LIRCAFEAANKIGDLAFAGYCCNHLNTNLLAAGEPLDEIQREAERGSPLWKRSSFALAEGTVAPQIALVQILRGLTPKFGRLDMSGSPNLLDFTVVGPAVDEVIRIAVCADPPRRPCPSRPPFAASAADERRLVSVGRYALRGVGRHQELFTLDSQG
jgi:hypothetical protein